MREHIKNLPVKTKALTLFVSIAVIAAVVAMFAYKPKAGNQFTAAPPIQAVVGIPSVDTKVTNGTVKTLSKARVAKKIDLPADIAQDPKKEVTATAETAASENGTEIITTIDTETGTTQVFFREKEAPLFAFENKKRIGVAYGVGTEGNTLKVFGEWTFARVSNVHLSLQGEVADSMRRGPEAKAFAVIDYRF
jgi:hypothetical protein